MDTNVENYTIGELQTLFGLPEEDASDVDITNAANKIITKMEAEGKTTIVTFIEQARDKLLEHFMDLSETQLNADEATNEQFDATTTLGNWWQHQYPQQPNNPTQNQKLTDRNQKVQFFDATHQQMNREQLGIGQSFNIPVVQGTINPNLQNLTSRIVCIDSQYRQNILPYSNNPNTPTYNTDYTLDLSDPLTNVTSLKLYSIQIPTTWYAFDHSLGNTCLEYSGNIIDISDGNYSVADLSNVLNPLLAPLAVTFAGPLPYTGKVSFQNTGGTDASMVFYTGSGLCQQGCGVGAKINQNLGWNLGFRIPPDSSGVIAITIPAGQTVFSDVPADTYGPKYFILVVDDFNNNHLNNGLVNIVDTTTKLSVPTYYNPKDVECNNANQPFMVRTAPRTLTQAQLYTVNEIITNRKQTTNRTSAPTTTDVLAIIPIQLLTNFRPGPYVQFGQALQANIRTYFGPVNIDRLRVRLIDDKGNVVNLHDNDWSFTMVVEELYQY